MEADRDQETNYDRIHTPPHAPITQLHPPPQDNTPTTTEKPQPTPPTAIDTTTTSSSSPSLESNQLHPRKSLWQKLSILDKKRPNRMLDIFLAPFKGFTYPCIVYAGLMYGANALVWSGVQNATTGTVYTTRYGFSTSGVAAAYVSGIIGAVIG